MNFDSVLETVAIPKVESPSSTYSSVSKTNEDQLNYSNEDEEFQKYYELEKFHSSLKKNIQKSNIPAEITAKVGKSTQFNMINNKR